METESLNYAMCNLAIGTERQTTQLPSCWTWFQSTTGARALASPEAFIATQDGLQLP